MEHEEMARPGTPVVNNRLTEFSIRRPKAVLVVSLLLTILFLLPLPGIRTDTNPKNMLPPTSEVRVWNDSVDTAFRLYEDTIVVGVTHAEGVINPDTLAKIRDLTADIMRLPGVAARDVTSFTTIDDVTAGPEGLRVAPLVSRIPAMPEELAALNKALFGNPLFLDRMISRDGKSTAIYVPLEKGANGKVVADAIRGIVGRQSGAERYHIAGDPVARDTFGAEMFKLMGVFSPIAGAIMFAAFLVMFRSAFLAGTMMLVAMLGIVWSMGALIGLGFPVHIMSSMAPVFLMAIATDSIHIFNEFHFRLREGGDRTRAIRETMAAVSRPVRYTALATATGFAVLLLMQSVPVKVFGGVIAFGAVVLRLFSISLVPAALVLMPTRALARASVGEDAAADPVSRALRGMAGMGAGRPGAVAVVGLILVALATVGVTRIVVNNNLVEWFRPDSEVRVADRVINESLGGTSLGHIVVEGRAPDAMKTPEAQRYLEGLQRHLERLPVVGKTHSVADYTKRINRVLHDDDPRFEVIPDDAETIGQYLFLFNMSAKPADLDNVVDYPFQRANLWVQLKSWDASAMQAVILAMEEYRRTHPADFTLKPAGIAYFNLVWNNEVLWDLLRGFLLALAAVFVILVLNFRSVKWAIIGYAPLLFTILLLYGLVGFFGKDFDMPISVMSCLSLGMAVDFSIHFISRFRQHLGERGDSPTALEVREALLWTAARPGKGIVRNALLFALAFSVMLFAPLTPYMTVGAFIVGMMLLSALFTILYLPALVMLARPLLFPAAASEPVKGADS